MLFSTCLSQAISMENYALHAVLAKASNAQTLHLRAQLRPPGKKVVQNVRCILGRLELSRQNCETFRIRQRCSAVLLALLTPWTAWAGKSVVLASRKSCGGLAQARSLGCPRRSNRPPMGGTATDGKNYIPTGPPLWREDCPGIFFVTPWKDNSSANPRRNI